MNRKVIQLAGKTLVVSIPLKWAKLHNIKKGQELEVELGNNQLSVFTKNFKTALKTDLFLDCNEEFAKRRINTLYKRGLDQINVTVNNSKILNQIQEELNILLGFEIIDRSERACVIKNIALHIEEELNILLKRIFLINLEMTRLTEKLLQKKEEETLNELRNLEVMNDKLTNLCKRILNKQVNQRMDKTNLTYCLLWCLEKIADEYRWLGEEINKSKISSEMIKLIANINSFHRLFYEIYCKFNESKATTLSKEYEKLKQESFEFVKKNPLIGHHAINIIQNLYELAGPYYATIF
ncbi:hypothetical protein HY837_05550 [archaeon]|nr:hypothetical protein [archaeon]